MLLIEFVSSSIKPGRHIIFNLISSSIFLLKVDEFLSLKSTFLMASFSLLTFICAFFFKLFKTSYSTNSFSFSLIFLRSIIMALSTILVSFVLIRIIFYNCKIASWINLFRKLIVKSRYPYSVKKNLKIVRVRYKDI